MCAAATAALAEDSHPKAVGASPPDTPGAPQSTLQLPPTAHALTPANKIHSSHPFNSLPIVFAASPSLEACLERLNTFLRMAQRVIVLQNRQLSTWSER